MLSQLLEENNKTEEQEIKLGNIYYKLGYFYQQKKNYNEMLRYYLIAINKNNTFATVKLAGYYEHIEKNYDKAKKYYILGVEQNNSDAMFNLGQYYRCVENNFEEMKKYLSYNTNMKNLPKENLVGNGYYVLRKRNYM